MEYTCNIAHDGRTYTVTVPDLELPRCEKCGCMVMISESDRRIDAALRQQLGLIPPEEIRRQRENLGLTQKELAARLGVAEETLSRWETGWQIQQKAMDNLMRLFFRIPAVRSQLGWKDAMQASAYHNGGGIYGIRVKLSDREAHFDKWDEIEVEIDGKSHKFQLTEGFRKKCPEFRDSGQTVIQDWLKRHYTLPWPKRQPPQVQLIPLGGRRFRLLPQSRPTDP